LALGKSVREIEQWSNSEIAEWSAYYELEPFGQERSNLHAATIASILANANRGKDAAPFSVQDFMYKTAEEAREEEERKAIESLSSFFNHFDSLKEKGVLH
jgi:hypothetical protein